MEKSKVFFGVLAAGLAVSLVGNVYLWNSLNQKDTEYIAAMANLEEELAQNKEAQDTLRQQLEQTKADLEQAESQQEGNPDDPFAGMTEEDLMKELLDTSGAPTKGDLDKLAEDAKEKEQGGGQGQTGQSQGQGGQSQGQTGGQGQSGTSGLTPEQKAELDRIAKELGATEGGTKGGGTGGNIGDSYTGPGINWNK